jgi:hypothetical protein
MDLRMGVRAASAVLLCLAAAGPCLGAAEPDDWLQFGASQAVPAAPHPTALLGYYKDHPYPVVGVDGNIAVIDRDGKRARVTASSGFQTARVNAFLPGSLEVRRQAESSNKITRVWRFTNGAQADGGVVSTGSEYKATVVASRDYPECYVALLFYGVGYLRGETDDPHMAVAFDRLGDLRAGAETKVDASFVYVDFGGRPMYYLPIFFSRGREIRTNMSDTLGLLFRRVEMLRHEKVLALYRQKHAADTLAASPYLKFPPILPEHADLSGVPALLRVDFAVTEDGTVEDVTPAAVVPPAVAYAIQRTVGGWLFMPKLVNGIPRRSMVALNLDFSPGGAPGPGG